MDSTESPSRCPRPTEHGESDPIWLLYSATLLVGLWHFMIEYIQLIVCQASRLFVCRTLHMSPLGFPPLALTTSTSLKVCDALAFPRWAATLNTYKSVAHRPNLVVFAEARATKIGINRSEKDITARGVFFHFKSKPLTAKAGKEVVLSLSGTGNSNVLQKHKVCLKVGLLGAGENCQARVLVSTTYEVKKWFVTYDNLGYDHTFRADSENSGKARDRPLTVSHSMLSHIDLYFLASSAKIVHMRRWLWEDVRKEIHMVIPKEQYRIEELSLRKKMSNVEMLPHPGKYTVRDFPESLADRVVHHDCYLPTVTQSACLGHAQRLNTSDSVSPLAMDAKYLSKQLVKFADKLAKAEPLATILVARQGPSADSESDKVITKRAKGNNRTLHHPIGTAVMTSESLGGVVDEMPKVYGTSSLRVVCAVLQHPSVIAVHVAVQLHHTVYGIAERATDAIKSGSGF
ncbi:GMC oxidoreductase domain-containing protein [Rhizoctonia solani AG-1 IA]|uniref:GMC oxidoreductase domain-containing protein n=1 Tax=Thanatephorus cucumeris (strain AG1-IA) TaxID=983506 RepID=L8WHU7_THACA|nr:GMC oxidoreductase domain-containing protein [Rhizoctonia solani AG-1 IA]